mgnify:FL=1
MNTFDENDQRNHPRHETTDFSNMVDGLLSRRDWLGAAGAASMGLFFGGESLAQAGRTTKTAGTSGPRIG